MKKPFLLLSLGCTLLNALAASDNSFGASAVTGPLKVTVNADSKDYMPVSMALNADDQLLLDITKLGLKTTSRDFSELKLVDLNGTSDNAVEYDMLTGKRSHCYNVSNDRTFTFVNSSGDSLQLNLKIFPDGMAFRYVLPSGKDGECIESEYTTYNIENGKNRWFQPYNLVYEDFYPKATNGSDVNRRQDHKWGYPALYEAAPSQFVLITESDILRGHAGSLLSNEQRENRFKVVYGGGEQKVGKGGWTSPWRVLIAGELSDIVSSTLVTDVATPAVTEDVDWIKPAPVSWIYWANNHGSNDYEIIKDYIDLAVEMGWPYMLIDAEWDEMKDGKTIEDAIAYAHQRGVRPLIWYNSSTGWIDGAPGPKFRLNKKEDRIKEYAWLNQQGVDGVKIDFFDGDKVQDNDYCIDLLEDALDKHILVTLHGATLPRGWQRTYPNLMTVEAVYGAEWYNNNQVLTDRAAAHNATLPFTRNVVGPMDYTPGTFTDSQHPHITSHGHELALTVLFESALQHLPDRPSAYMSLPDEVKAMLSTLPTTWDDTALLSGYPGHHAVIARQKCDKWYIAGINGTDKEMALDFELPWPLDGYTATLIHDGDEQMEFGPIVTAEVTKRHMSVPCRPRGGFVLILTPQD